MTMDPDSAATELEKVAFGAAQPPLDRRARVRRLIRYGAVNIASLGIDYAIFIPLTALLAMPVLASVVAYGVAFAVNYVLSRRFVFHGEGAHKSERRLFTEFMATGMLGVALTAGVTGGAIHLLGATPVAAKTAAVLFCFVVLYLVRSRLVFTRLS